MPCHNAPATVIMRTLANIPGIEVPTDKHDLISLFPAFEFSDNVCRLRVRQKLRAHLYPQCGVFASIVHALQEFSSFYGDGCGWYFWRSLVVSHRTSVR